MSDLPVLGLSRKGKGKIPVRSRGRYPKREGGERPHAVGKGKKSLRASLKEKGKSRQPLTSEGTDGHL